MTGFASPNYTQTPNEFFDKYLPLITDLSELKVTMAIIRQTLGFQKMKDPISLSRLQKLTGLSRPSVIDGAEKAVARGLIAVVGTGARGVTIYGLVIDGESSPDWSSNFTSTSKATLHTKETNKRKRKDMSPDGNGGSKTKTKPERVYPPNPLFDAVLLGSWGLHKVNGNKTVAAMVGKIVSWLKANDENVTAERVTAFYEWYSEGDTPPAAPRDVGKFASWWLKFEADDEDEAAGWAKILGNVT